MEYSKIALDTKFNIKRIVTLHYYEFAKHFVFKGERHDFWEFLYVDRGEVEVASDKKGYILTQGDIIFHKPNEFHSVSANRVSAPNVVVICFECNSEAMSYFKNKIFSLGNEERELLFDIVKEGFNAFKEPLGNPLKNILQRKDNSLFGCEQLIKVYLEILLITIVRKGKSLSGESKLSSFTKKRSDNEGVQHLVSLITSNLNKNYTLDDFCNYSKMSKTHLTRVFKKVTGMGAIEYYRKAKIERAKILIREGNYNITEISELLGYNSIHYFSRAFKKLEGCTPSEYAKSIKARL